MKALELLDAAPYDRNTAEVLKQALADAWASIALTTRPELAQNIRLSLTPAILAHAGSGAIERKALTAAALNAIRRHQPQLAQLD